MLKSILNLKGIEKLTKNSQKEILGGRRKLAECVNASHCPINHICQNGTCFNCYAGNGLWYC